MGLTLEGVAQCEGECLQVHVKGMIPIIDPCICGEDRVLRVLKCARTLRISAQRANRDEKAVAIPLRVPE